MNILIKWSDLTRDTKYDTRLTSLTKLHSLLHPHNMQCPVRHTHKLTYKEVAWLNLDLKLVLP